MVIKDTYVLFPQPMTIALYMVQRTLPDMNKDYVCMPVCGMYVFTQACRCEYMHGGAKASITTVF